MRQRSIRLMLCAALVGSASLAAVIIPGSVSSASPLTLSCTSFTGNATTQSLSGCTGTGATAANAGTPPAKGTESASTKLITWTSTHKTTNMSGVKYASGSKANCPALAKYAAADYEKVSGTIKSGGTALGLVGGTVSGVICAYTLVAAPHTLILKNVGVFKL